MTYSTQNLMNSLKRPVAFLAAMGMLFAAGSGVVQAAAAGGQVQSRSIRMSDNGVSGNSTITSGVGSGTNVTYRVTFEAATSYSIKGVVLDFCSGSAGTPFIGDSTCGAPTGFTVGGSPVIDTADYDPDTAGPIASVAGLGSTANWTASSINSGQTLIMTNATGEALTSGTDYTFAVSGVTNTSTLGTFYARLLTYTSDTGDIASYAHGTVGTYQDYGGFALSTANIVEVTAKVQEALEFCVVGSSTQPPAAPTAPTDCTGQIAPAIILGHGTNNTLDATAVDVNTVYSYASTNALNGLSIRMRNSNPCGGLSTDNGTTCAIPALSSGANTPSAIAAGTAGFGMFCEDSTGGSGSSIDCDAGYNNSTNVTFPSDAHYGMDSTTAGDNVTSTFGDIIAASTGPSNAAINQYNFAATASNTTPAGIYKANLAMIATGSF